MDIRSYEAQAEASRMTGGFIPHPLAQPLSGGPFSSPLEVAHFGKPPSSSYSSSSSADSGEGLAYLIIMVLLSPPFILPGWAVYQTWLSLSSAEWHPVFKLLATGGEIFVFWCAVWMFYRFLPKILCTAVTAFYIAACYGAVAYHFGATQVWYAIIAIGTGIAGYYVGRAAHGRITRAAKTFGDLARGTIATVSFWSSSFAIIALWAACIASGGVFGRQQILPLLQSDGVNPLIITAIGICYLTLLATAPLYIGRRLVRYTPQWLAIGILGVILIYSTYVIMNMFGCDYIWTSAAMITAGLGSPGVRKAFTRSSSSGRPGSSPSHSGLGTAARPDAFRGPAIRR